MAGGLLGSSVVFRERMVECEAALAPFVDWSLLEVVSQDDGGWLDRVDVVQPVLWAVMVSLAAVWGSCGVVPGAVVGHSQGEIAAAVVAGVLSLADGARVVALRSQVIGRLAKGGGMVSLAVSEAEARELLKGSELSVAVVNSSSAVVVAGESEALDELLVLCEGRGVRARRVPVDYASHSPQVEVVRDELLDVLGPVAPGAGEVPLYSSVTGGLVDGSGLDAGYWYTNLRQTVRFETAVQSLLADGFDAFVEVSGHPVLTAAVEQTAEQASGGPDVVVLGTLRRDEDEQRRLLMSLGEAFTAGLPVDWSAVLPADATPVDDLPTYAFQRERYWLHATPAHPGTGEAQSDDHAERQFWQALDSGDHIALGDALGVADSAQVGDVISLLTPWRRHNRRLSASDGWRYRIGWHPVAADDATRLTGTWLLVAPSGRPDDALLAGVEDALTRSGADVVRLSADANLDRAGLARCLAALDIPEPSGVLSLLAHDEARHPEHPELAVGVTATLTLLQALGDAGIDAPLWCTTRGAARVPGTDGETSPEQAQAWGLGLVAGLEHPERWGGLVDLPETPDEQAVRHLARVVAGLNGEDQVAVRRAGVFARRLLRAMPPKARHATAWRPRGTVLITGGTGAVGSHVARWLAANGAEHLVLISRSGRSTADSEALEAELAALGARTTIEACDVTDRAALADLVDRVASEESPIRAVIHAAGAVSSIPVADTRIEDLAEVISAKVVGATHLDGLFQDADTLDAFILFSSGAGIWGGSGQAAYAAANAHLDALAHSRRAKGLPAVAMAWGMWNGGGMAGGDVAGWMRSRGLRAMAPETAVAVLGDTALAHETSVVVADIDWQRFAPQFTVARPSALLSALPEAQEALEGGDTAGPAAAVATQAPDSALRTSLTGLSEAEQHAMVLDLVRARAAEVLGHGTFDAISPGKAFRDFGFDSLTAVQLRNRLNAVTGLRLPTTVVFDHPTPMALARFVRAEVLGVREAAAELVPVAPVVLGSGAEDPVAVVGMGCRFPGG
ncbi:SDR family NAD(P)-dependent oxidoreductase, partial [Streptomyces sp. NBS 14/10]|uniref:SDR family NAD(P)-dependent oxidoreductase n=1 Tax=Streptomyces sp. NBS 14/10 TaxID=1945643 RepID=UPI0015C695F8